MLANSQAEDRKLLGEYRLTTMQRAFFATQLNSEATEEYLQFATLKFAFLVEPGIDLRKLERALQRLTARHETLRMSYAKIDDSWRVRVWDRHRTGVVVENFGEVSESERIDVASKVADRPLNFLEDDLVQVVVARTAGSGDIMVVRAHHSVADGHSMLILAEELLRLLIGIPVFGEGVSHAAYLREVEDLSPQRRMEIESYWQNLLFPVLPQPGSGSFGRGVKSPRRIFAMNNFQSVRRTMALHDFKRLPALAGEPAQTGFSIILAAFAQALIDVSGLPGVFVTIVIDRVSSRLQTYVGCATHSFPVRCENPKGLALGKFAASLSAQIKESSAHMPSEAAGPELRFDQDVYRAGGVTRHFTCVESFHSARAKSSPFSKSLEAPAGTKLKLGSISVTRLPLVAQNFSPAGLGLSYVRDNDAVRLSFSYHSHLYSSDNINTLIEALQNLLGIRFD